MEEKVLNNLALFSSRREEREMNEKLSSWNVGMGEKSWFMTFSANCCNFSTFCWEFSRFFSFPLSLSTVITWKLSGKITCESWTHSINALQFDKWTRIVWFSDFPLDKWPNFSMLRFLWIAHKLKWFPLWRVQIRCAHFHFNRIN